MSTNKSQFKLTKVNPAYWRATFDNPPINMLGPETMLELQGLVGQFEKDPDLKVVVFDSADPDFFIAHFDISRAADTPRQPGPSGLPPWTDLTVRLARAPVISIAAVRGRARGVGNEFALACDLRFASLEKAIFGQPEVGSGRIHFAALGSAAIKLLFSSSDRIPVVSENCVMCHANFKGNKGNVGALSYTVPLIE
jgi:enoyl-CoA hydratase/carnithine racemase